MRKNTEALVELGVIPHAHWVQPNWIDEKKARAYRDELVGMKIIHGGS
jgi:alpha 1,2-mannosyltransferase